MQEPIVLAGTHYPLEEEHPNKEHTTDPGWLQVLGVCRQRKGSRNNHTGKASVAKNALADCSVLHVASYTWLIVYHI
jgi:hypothetical protein